MEAEGQRRPESEPDAARRPRRSRGWTRRKIHVAQPAERGPGRPAGTTQLAKEIPDAQWRVLFTDPKVFFWTSEWRSTFGRELLVYKALGMFDKAGELLDTAPASTYLLDSVATEASQMKRMTQDIFAVMRWCAEAMHRRNTRLIPPSMAGRSIAMLGHKVPKHVWQVDGTIVSKPVVIKWIHELTAVRPAPAFQQSLRILFYVGDQVWRNMETRHSRKPGTSQDRIDGTGAAFRQAWQREVFFNYFRVPVPLSLAQLTQEDVDLLRRDGPLTQSYIVGGFELLHPRRVLAHTRTTHNAATRRAHSHLAAVSWLGPYSPLARRSPYVHCSPYVLCRSGECSTTGVVTSAHRSCTCCRSTVVNFMTCPQARSRAACLADLTPTLEARPTSRWQSRSLAATRNHTGT